jgi:hypothetical protein
VHVASLSHPAPGFLLRFVGPDEEIGVPSGATRDLGRPVRLSHL